MTALSSFIAKTPLADTHEHLQPEERWLSEKPDLFTVLFGDWYLKADLVAAGLTQDTLAATFSGKEDVRVQYKMIEKAWQQVRYTGYGEAMQLCATHVYGIDVITAESLVDAAPRQTALCRPGEMRRILHDLAGVTHVQIDDFTWSQRQPSPLGSRPVQLPAPGFFMYDLSFADFSSARFDVSTLEADTGVSVGDPASLRRALATLFTRRTGVDVAIKSQHAYSRTLSWQERSDHEVAPILQAYLKNPRSLTEQDRLALGDWCLARGVELAVECGLAVKFHTGYAAGNWSMQPDRMRSAHLAPLVGKYPQARFVMMHTAYPYSEELLAMAKHYPNVWVDLCWAWAINPRATAEFVRRFLHGAPLHKLLGFGGDTDLAPRTVGYAFQARKWLTKALEAEVAEENMTEVEAMAVARQVMWENAHTLFGLPAPRNGVE